MTAGYLRFFKFVSELIDCGLWANMSSGARALYPVLLRFSDGNYKPVYPGSKVLLKLTGFKQKTSLRRARAELVELGLISVTKGSGRRNSYYHFRFDWATDPHGDTPRSPTGVRGDPRGGSGRALRESSGSIPAYNNINISINSNVHNSKNKKHSGEKGYNQERIRKILYCQNGVDDGSWSNVKNYIGARISKESMTMIEQAFKAEENGVLIFSNRLPDYLKQMLRRINVPIFFEPDDNISESRQQFWESAGAGS